MKKGVALILVMLVLLSVTACGYRFPEELEQYAIPWEVNAVKQAKEDGCIHYYFMSAQGMITDPTHPNYPEKWGDSCLIVFPDGKTMLLDTGMQTYAQVLVENLKRLGIKKLDYMMFSHPHNDHCYAALVEGGVFDAFEVGQVYHNGAFNENWTIGVTAIDDICKQKNIPVQILKQGDALDFGLVSAKILWPREGIAGQTFTSGHEYDAVEDINNSSIVIRFDYKNHSSLFGGDVFVSGEEEMVADYSGEKELLDVDLMKAMHHGSQTSNSATLLFATTPELVVSTGYAPIVDEVKEVVDAVGAQLLNDRDFGYIHISSDGDRMTYEIGQK